MAVFVEAMNIVIPVSRLEESYPGGVEGYERDCPNSTFLRDEHLTRVGFLSAATARQFVESITETTSLRFQDGDVFADIAAVDGDEGPLAPCSWLDYGRTDGFGCCWLHGTDSGTLRIPLVLLESRPTRLEPEQGEKLIPLPPEDGLARFQDPESGKILYTTLDTSEESEETKEC